MDGGYLRRLAIEARRFDLRVHRDTTRPLPDRAFLLLEYGEYLLEHGGYLLEHGGYLLELLKLSCRFGVNRVQSPKHYVRRYECTDLQSHLVVMVVSKLRLQKPERRPPYLPSSADATNLRIYCDQFLAQVSRFP